MLSINWRKFNQHKVKLFLVFSWLFIFSLHDNQLILIGDYASFIMLGVIGAIFANATGAGGGVVFVPIFNQLSLDNTVIVATSFAIQCCGMTAGAITWWRYYRTHHQYDDTWQLLPKWLHLLVPVSILGVLIAQYGLSEYTASAIDSLHLYFGAFSIILALAIFASIPLMKRQVFRSNVSIVDFAFLIGIAFGGGMVTAFLSIGVGELIAVYLILRGFNITMAIALAVIVSAFTVWCAVFYHLMITQVIYWQIVMFAGAGAIIGGLIAKHLVLYFSASKLKMFFASWVLFMGLAGLPVW